MQIFIYNNNFGASIKKSAIWEKQRRVVKAQKEMIGIRISCQYATILHTIF